MLLSVLVVSVVTSFPPHDLIKERLQIIATSNSPQWNQSGIEITYLDSEGHVAVAGGYADERPKELAKPGDAVLYGSVTKLITAATVLKLIEEKIYNFNTKAVDVLDGYFKIHNGTTLTDLWNSTFITKVTLRDLLRMTSGIPDYDTPGLRKYQNDNPSLTITPWDIVHSANKTCNCQSRSTSCASYSSTNYVLLGFVLAAHQNVTWDKLDQRIILPRHSDPAVYKTLQFVTNGELRSFNKEPELTVSHGYQPDGSDVWGISAVGGWTCGNMLGSHIDVAQFLVDYLESYLILSENFIKSEVFKFTYLPELHLPYGMGIQNVTLNNSGSLYGHLGSTYGFYSAALYNSEFKYSIVLSMNYEQPQPWMGMWNVMSFVIGNLTQLFRK